MENYRKYNGEIRKGDIFIVDLPMSEDNVQGGTRPCIVVQNNKGNGVSPNLIVLPLTSRQKKRLPTHVLINAGCGGLERDSTALGENPVTISKSKLGSYIGRADDGIVEQINKAIQISFGLITQNLNSTLDKAVSVC